MRMRSTTSRPDFFAEILKAADKFTGQAFGQQLGGHVGDEGGDVGTFFGDGETLAGEGFDFDLIGEDLIRDTIDRDGQVAVVMKAMRNAFAVQGEDGFLNSRELAAILLPQLFGEGLDGVVQASVLASSRRTFLTLSSSMSRSS